MPAIATTLETLDKFISLAKEVAKLPAMVLPQYQTSAQDLYEICQKLLAANENLSRWLYQFLYFDFRNAEARSKFLELMQDYSTMKNGPEFQRLKFSCADIRQIYCRNISSKIVHWFTNKAKGEDAEGLFSKLTNADEDLVAFTYDYVVRRMDDLAMQAESHVNKGNMNDAEETRLRFKAELRDVTERLEKFSGELSDLVVSFAGVARVPVTIGA